MTKPTTSILWFRQDLRLEDNPALQAASERGGEIIFLFIAPNAKEPWTPGGASRYWLHQSLSALQKSLAKHRAALIIRRGEALSVLKKIISESKASAVFWNRRYEPASIRLDTHLKQELKKQGVEAQSFKANLLFEPHEIKNQQGKPYQVFTPFWKACLVSENQIAEPLVVPRIQAYSQTLFSENLDTLELQPKIPWADGIAKAWRMGEVAALQILEDFIERALADYAEGRDRPGQIGTSRLSPYLHFGEISPRQIWHAIRTVQARHAGNLFFKNAEVYLREVVWREFAHHLLFHFPHTPEQPLRSEFSRFPWRQDPEALRDWQKGQTGYPIVDAGMRELWVTGWMHNRVRMIVASFLVKDLLISWQEGARWFWDTLVDADLANNTLGWQWTAGCGADAAPYFRIFNPILQGEKFDSRGDYVRRWVPELKRMPDRFIHKPWEAPENILKEAGLKLGQDYPRPIVDHGEARDRALQALEKVKKS